MDQLPTEFDLLVIGTGIIESMVSAAASRIGKSVLHIDSNDYYGGQWASFNLKTLHNFSPSRPDQVETIDNPLPIGNDVFNIGNFQCKWYIPEKAKIKDNKSSIERDLQNLSICGEADVNHPPKEDAETEEISKSREEEANEEHSYTDSKAEVEHTQESLLRDSRKFNIDLIPKLHFARGKFVELLISSNIARYAEYRSVSRVLTWLNGELQIVPCSRSDVFANNQVSVIEKRMLMKLLTSLDESNDNFKGDQNTTFYQFLKHNKLSPNLIHYVLYAMARSTEETSLRKGVENTKRFLNSLGRFGKTPFLFSMYGSGETTQAFCRLSAVFGGVYALSQQSLTSIKAENNKIRSLVNGNQEIKAEHFVLSAEKAPKPFVKSIQIKEYIARAILITDRSIMPSEQEHLTLLMYPPENGKNLVTIIEMGSLTGTCPKHLFLVHLISRQIEKPQDDFQHIINKLFKLFALESDVTNSEPLTRPQILWSCFFSVPESTNLDLGKDLPENVHLCSGPDLDLDYDLNIKKAKDIFEKIYPDLEFLPRAPDPEEIVIGGEASQEESETFTNDITEEDNTQ